MSTPISKKFLLDVIRLIPIGKKGSGISPTPHILVLGYLALVHRFGGGGDGIELHLALLGNLALGLGQSTTLGKLIAQSRGFLSGLPDGGTDVGGGLGNANLGQILDDVSHDRLVGDGGLGGLAGALCVALVHLDDGIGSELLNLGGDVTRSNGGIELTVSHNGFLSALFALERWSLPFFLGGFLSLLTLSIIADNASFVKGFFNFFSCFLLPSG